VTNPTEPTRRSATVAEHACIQGIGRKSTSGSEKKAIERGFPRVWSEIVHAYSRMGNRFTRLVFLHHSPSPSHLPGFTTTIARNSIR
jgi:hypothetical protein